MSYNEDVRELKRNKPKARKTYPNGYQQLKFSFHNISLTKEDRTNVLSWASELTLVIDALTAIVGAGFNLSIKYSEPNECFVASLTCMNVDNVNHGSVASAFSSSPDRALFTVLWVVAEKWGTTTLWPKSVVAQDDW